MNKTRLKINDTIFATVISGGNMILKVTLSGFDSMQALMKSLVGHLSGVAGLVTVELRNTTMGWAERRSVRLSPASTAPVQLTLF